MVATRRIPPRSRARRSRRAPRSSWSCSAAAPRPTTTQGRRRRSADAGGASDAGRGRRPTSGGGRRGPGRDVQRPPAATRSGGTPVEQQKVISTGNVQLRSDDVGQAIFDVRKVVDVHGGTIAEDDTETDKDGDAFRSRMVLRIPTADFDDAMAELEKVATLVSSKRASGGRDHPGPRHRRPGRGPAAQHRPDPGPLRQRHLDQGHRQHRERAVPPPGRPRLAGGAAALPRRPDLDVDDHARGRADPEGDQAQAEGRTTRRASCPGCRTAGAHSRPSWSARSTVAGALLPWLLLALVLAVPGWPLVRRLRRRVTAAA